MLCKDNLHSLPPLLPLSLPPSTLPASPLPSHYLSTPLPPPPQRHRVLLFAPITSPPLNPIFTIPPASEGWTGCTSKGGSTGKGSSPQEVVKKTSITLSRLLPKNARGPEKFMTARETLSGAVKRKRPT